MKRRKFLQLLGLSAVAVPVVAKVINTDVVTDKPKGYLIQNNDIHVITFSATNNNGTTWSTDGLPVGITLDSKTGFISGEL